MKGIAGLFAILALALGAAFLGKSSSTSSTTDSSTVNLSGTLTLTESQVVSNIKSSNVNLTTEYATSIAESTQANVVSGAAIPVSSVPSNYPGYELFAAAVANNPTLAILPGGRR